MKSTELVSTAQLHRTEYYADWLRPQGVGYCLGGPVLRRAGAVAVFSISRLEQRGPFTPEEERLLRLLMPHLRRACLLHWRMARLGNEHDSALCALDSLSTAVWLLDAQGRLLFANQAGRELDVQHDGLWIDRDGRPLAARPCEQQVLKQAIAEAIAAAHGTTLRCGGAVRVRRSRRPGMLLTIAYPLAGAGPMPGSAAALFICDPSMACQPDTRALRLLYELTPAEAGIAVALARGDSLERCGQARGVSGNTVRTHLRRIMAKTETHCQADLVRRVAAVASVRARS